jgi:hypothetical protein
MHSDTHTACPAEPKRSLVAQGLMPFDGGYGMPGRGRPHPFGENT